MKILIIVQDFMVSGTSEGVVSRSFLLIGTIISNAQLMWFY
jgi:hypothetical protein